MTDITRLARLRRTPTLRRMAQETRLDVAALIQPYFVIHWSGKKEPISTMPGQFRWSVDTLVEEAARIHALGVPAVLLFGLPERKDEQGSGAWSDEEIVPQAIRALKAALPDLVVITDVCMCEYTSHGHCGIITPDGQIDGDATLPLLARSAVTYARAGADIVAPSDMFDGRIGIIREALDGADCERTAILSYAIKFASAFYGPFREAADSAPAFGDRKSHQMDPANAREALAEALQDVAEGADAVMVKPGMPYLDILRTLRNEVLCPVAVYQVSGEYSMLKAAIERGWLEERRAVLESLLAFRRAGADWIITYFAAEAAEWLKTSA